MFKKIENLLNRTKENSQENKYKDIKEKYGEKIALLLFSMGIGLPTADKISAQETPSQFLSDSKSEDIPTISLENGASMGVDITPIDIPKMGGVIEVFLGKDYEILIQSEDPRNEGIMNTLRVDKRLKGYQQIHFSPEYTYIFRDPETGQSFTMKGLGLTDEDIKNLSELTPENIAKIKTETEKLWQERTKRDHDNPLVQKEKMENDLKQQVINIDAHK